MNAEGGSVSVSVMGVAAAAMLLILGLADLGLFTVYRARAQTAADAAALAAVQEMVPGGHADPRDEASIYAGRNGAELLSCACGVHAREAVVRVAVPARFMIVRLLGASSVEARARAVVDLGSPG